VSHFSLFLSSHISSPSDSTPNDNQLVIKVVYAGSNPKDWKLPELGVPGNSGDDAAGYVHSVGAKVSEFKVGDRVAIFHEMTKEGGTFAEYALAWEHTTFHLPKETSFEGGATIPLAGELRDCHLRRDIGC
jgi:NADPH:quinone reductase-like Zn-dependent oxidoreductase